MDRFLPTPRVHRGLRSAEVRSSWRSPAALLALLVLPLLLVVPAGSPGLSGAHLAAPRAAASERAAVAPRPADATYGDILVTPANSPFVLAGAPGTVAQFFVQGNITVEAGGLLEIDNAVVSLVQYVGATGSLAQRLSHLFAVRDAGTIDLTNSVLNSTFAPINPYPKIYVNVSAGGRLDLDHSEIQGPGWIDVYGHDSTLNLTNASQIEPNPSAYHAAVKGENWTLFGDEIYAPTLNASGGAQVNFFDSTYNGTYGDNVTRWGVPGIPGPFDAPPFAVPSFSDDTQATLTNAAGGSWDSFALYPDNTENLTRAILYRSVDQGSITLDYSATNDASSLSNHLDYNGSIALPTVGFPAPGGQVTVPLPSAALADVNSTGLAAFLAALSSGGASFQLGVLNAASTVTVTNFTVSFAPALDYNLTFSGVGTVFTAVDSTIGVNWNLTPGLYQPSAPLFTAPWLSNKVLLEDGASGYFASVTVPVPITGLFWNDSAILPDDSSQAVFYRWVGVSVQGAADNPLEGAVTQAFYGLNSNQKNNVTATTFNDLQGADAALAGYVNAFDAAQGVGSYGATDPSGTAYLLLASTYLNGSLLPQGDFLGVYHVAITVGGIPNGTQWITAGTTAYPSGMDPATPDMVSSPVTYPSYAPAVTIPSTSILVNGVTVSNATVALGETLSIQALVRDSGEAAVENVTASLSYLEKAPLAPKVVVPTLTLGDLAPSQGATVNLTWLVAENVTGDVGTVHAQLEILVEYFGGVVPLVVPITIVPAYIAFTYTPPTTPLRQGQDTFSGGTITYIGRHNATLNVTAVNAHGSYLLASVSTGPGPFDAYLTPFTDMASGTYTLNVSAYYNNRTVYQLFPNAATLASSSSAAPVPWYQQSVLGLPLYLWIVIVAIVVVGLLVALMVLRSRAKGKLVECGECGELIPEAATVCPKCGAEFEADLVRCSRCSSTIPANSAQCPECAAQLLGPETADPERQGYQDFVERFRTEARKELGENYGEGAFWDWWKRQGSYVPYNQWKLQQSEGSRVGMGVPPAQAEAAPAAPAASPPARESAPTPAAAPPTYTLPPRAQPPAGPAPPSGGAAPAAAPPTRAAPSPPAAAPPAGGGPAMKPCSNCGKEIPPDYLVCPFCGAVTR